MVTSGTFLGGAHDAVATAGDDHEMTLDQLAPHLLGHLELGRFGLQPGRTENGDLLASAVRLENLRRVAKLLESADEQFEIRHGGLVPPQPQRCLHHFFDESRRVHAPAPGHEFLDRSLFFFVHRNRPI